MENSEFTKSKPLHEVLFVTAGLLQLQHHKDVAIPYWRGAPGIAKTSLAKAMCSMDNRKWTFMGTHYSLKPIEEISGLPTFEDVTINGQIIKGTKWTLPDILTELLILADNNNELVVWLLDDFHLAPPTMMQLGYEMFTDWKLRGFKIPDNVVFLLAGNFSAKAGSKKNLTSAVANRCAIMNVHMEFDYWKNNYAIPNKLNSKIIAFLGNVKYQKYFQEEEQLDRPWASARSWTRFSNLLTPLESSYSINNKTMPQSEVLYYAAAHIGDEAASEFAIFYKLFGEVKTKEIFEGTHPIVIPTNLTDQYIYILATTNEFANIYSQNNKSTKDKSLETMASIICHMINVRSEMGVTGMKEIALIEKTLNLRDIYGKLKTMIQMKDHEVAKRIEIDITQI